MIFVFIKCPPGQAYFRFGFGRMLDTSWTALASLIRTRTLQQHADGGKRNGNAHFAARLELNWIELNHSMYIRSMFCCLWNPLNSSSLQFAPIHWQNYYLPHAGSTKEKEGNRQNKRTQRNYPWFYPVFLMLGQAWSRRDSRCRCSTECWNQHEIIQEHNTYSFVIVCVIHVCVCVSWSQNRIGTKFCEAQWEMERKQFITHIACCRAWPIDPQLMEDLGHWWPSVSTALALSFFGHPLPKFPRQCFNGTPSLWKRR